MEELPPADCSVMAPDRLSPPHTRQPTRAPVTEGCPARTPPGPHPSAPVTPDPRAMTSTTVPTETFDYERIPPGYYDHVHRRRKGMQSKWHHLKFQRVARELDGYHRVLDVGCGPGTLAGNSPEHDWVGVDLSSRQIEYARATYGHEGARFYDLSPAELPDDERDFDAVTMVELIEHIDPLQLETTLDDALARVRPGGKVVLTTPNFHSPWPLV